MQLSLSFPTRNDVLCPICDRPILNGSHAFYADHLICVECWKLSASLINAALHFVHNNAGPAAFTYATGLMIFTPDVHRLRALRKATAEIRPSLHASQLPHHRPRVMADENHRAALPPSHPYVQQPASTSQPERPESE